MPVSWGSVPVAITENMFDSREVSETCVEKIGLGIEGWRGNAEGIVFPWHALSHHGTHDGFIYHSPYEATKPPETGQ